MPWWTWRRRSSKAPRDGRERRQGPDALEADYCEQHLDRDLADDQRGPVEPAADPCAGLSLPASRRPARSRNLTTAYAEDG